MNKSELLASMAEKGKITKVDAERASKAPVFKAGKSLKEIVNK